MTISKENRRAALERQVARLDKRKMLLQDQENQLSLLRLMSFFAGVGGSTLAFVLAGGLWGTAVSLITIIIFVGAVMLHRRVSRSVRRHAGWRAWGVAQLGRMAVDWSAIPPSLLTETLTDLERDFDLVGEFSLHHLLNTAVSPEGSGRLRHWLHATEPKPLETARRQRLVRELAPLSLLRGRLHLSAELATESDSWTTEKILYWLETHEAEDNFATWLIGLAALSGITILLFLLNLLFGIGAWWQITWFPYVLLYLSKFRLQVSARTDGTRVKKGVFQFTDVAQLAESLRRITAVFNEIERFNFAKSPELAELCAPFQLDEKRPSRLLRQVLRVASALGLQANPLVGITLNAILPWDMYFSYRLHQYRADLVEKLPEWLDVWYELEAAGSLANFAYLNPSYAFPTFVEVGKRPLFASKQLGHPLLMEDKRVSNDFALDELGMVTIFTGSNMAGKSTFLRTAGISLVLAQAGGPVCATSLSLVPFRLFSSVRVTDSVTDGISYFYAEVRRLKTLLETAEAEATYPLFFFVDEIFRGTNNRERLIGSRAYIKALVGTFGVGLVSTHDLELVQLADEMAQVQNYHFRERVENGRMQFDYLLRSGPSPTTNALKIMRMEGLPVPEGLDIIVESGEK